MGPIRSPTMSKRTCCGRTGQFNFVLACASERRPFFTYIGFAHFYPLWGVHPPGIATGEVGGSNGPWRGGLREAEAGAFERSRRF